MSKILTPEEALRFINIEFKKTLNPFYGKKNNSKNRKLIKIRTKNYLKKLTSSFLGEHSYKNGIKSLVTLSEDKQFYNVDIKYEKPLVRFYIEAKLVVQNPDNAIIIPALNG